VSGLSLDRLENLGEDLLDFQVIVYLEKWWSNIIKPIQDAVVGIVYADDALTHILH
jgi:Domain of unknown function (DUF4351)